MKRRNHRRNHTLHSPPVCPFRPGDSIQAISMFNCHDYVRGKTYTVVSIDPNDSTLNAKDSGGKVHGWIRWQDCKLAHHIGWDWLKTKLSTEALELLLAFDGLQRLRLRHDVALALIQGIPSLKERVIGCTAKLESDLESTH